MTEDMSLQLMKIKTLRRKRFQKGSLQKRKHGRHWKWVGFWRENGGRPCKVLGSCSQMSKGEAEVAFSHLLRRVNEGADRQAKPSYTFDKFVGDVFTVRERLYKGAFDTPKNGKSRDGAISAGTLELLTEWANLAQDPEGYVFPSERLATPLSRDNLWRRYMRPELAKMGLAWATFQVLRKTNASMAHKSGADPKVSADQRGHGMGVSMDTYTSSDIDQKRAAMQKLEIHLAPTRRTE